MRTREKVGTSTAKNSAKKKTAEQVPNIKELLLNGPRFEIIVPTHEVAPPPAVIFD
jgi:hypothetical protein